MTTKANTKKVVKKATKVTTRTSTVVTLTSKQALNIQAFLLKNGKTLKFLDTKISALNA